MIGRLLLVLAMTLTTTAATTLPRMENPALSPDGRYLAYLSRDASGAVALEVLNLDQDDARSRVLDGKRIAWCGWGNSERLVCGYEGAGVIAINADGSALRPLLTQQAQVLDWRRDDLKSVLIQTQREGQDYPSVHRLDLYTGALEQKVAAMAPIRHFALDEDGEVRFGWGDENGTVAAFSRLGTERLWRGLKWKRLTRFKPASGPNVLRPLPERRVVHDRVDAMSLVGNSDSTWEIDLTDASDPERVSEGFSAGKAEPIVSPTGQLLGMAFPKGDRAPIWFNGHVDTVAERVGAKLPGTTNAVVDFVYNPARYIVRSEHGREPARFYLYGAAGGDYELRELGRTDGAASSSVAAAAATVPAATPGFEQLDLLITLLDPDQKPVKGLPMRVVLSSDPQWQSADAGKRYVTDDRGRVRDTRQIRLESRRVNLDIPLVTHEARGFEIGIEIKVDGMPLLYTLTLDEVKKAAGVLISDTQVYTRGGDARFTREVDLTWTATGRSERDVYTLPPRDPKTFERLPDPPSKRLTERNLQLLPHPKADGSTRWALDLRLSLDPYKPREGG